jgi:hypothetical protein
MVKSLRIYEEQNGRSIGPLSTYLYRVIQNEAYRIYSKHKKMGNEDGGEIADTMIVPGAPNSDGLEDLRLRDRVWAFAKYAFSLGVYVDQEKLYRNCVLEFETPAVKAFRWRSILGQGLA